MDSIDKQILEILAENARTPVKDIAEKVSLTSPAVSSRIHKLERDGIIDRYTIAIGGSGQNDSIDALIGLSLTPVKRDELMKMLYDLPEIIKCYHVTGNYSFMVQVSCRSMDRLEQLITAFQRYGQTSTQIILSTPLSRTIGDTLQRLPVND